MLKQDMAIASLLMTVEPTHPTLHDLAAEIGQVLICWSFLENEMRKQLVEAETTADIARGPIISHWRAHLRRFTRGDYKDPISAVDRIAVGRNLLAHGIQSVNADPWIESSATVTRSAPGGSSHQLTIHAIRRLAEEIDKVMLSMRREFRRLNSAEPGKS